MFSRDAVGANLPLRRSNSSNKVYVGGQREKEEEENGMEGSFSHLITQEGKRRGEGWLTLFLPGWVGGLLLPFPARAACRAKAEQTEGYSKRFAIFEFA